MANKSFYVPVYMVGSDGKKAYELLKVSGTILQGPDQTVPEGEPCINSRAMTVTPPAKLQPKGNRPAAAGPPGGN